MWRMPWPTRSRAGLAHREPLVHEAHGHRSFSDGRVRTWTCRGDRPVAEDPGRDGLQIGVRRASSVRRPLVGIHPVLRDRDE